MVGVGFDVAVGTTTAGLEHAGHSSIATAITHISIIASATSPNHCCEVCFAAGVRVAEKTHVRAGLG